MPLNEVEWELYELPIVGANYWHGRDGYHVKALDESVDPPRLDLELDRDFEEALCGSLPDEYFVDGGRRADDGSWHFEVTGPQGPLGGDAWSIGEDMEQAIRQVVASAGRQLDRRG